MELNGYEVLKTIDAIMEGIENERRAKTMDQRIRAYVVSRTSSAWADCDVQAHRVSDGRLWYVASRWCNGCRLTHTFLVEILSDGTFALATLPREE